MCLCEIFEATIRSVIHGYVSFLLKVNSRNKLGLSCYRYENRLIKCNVSLEPIGLI